MPKVLIIDDSRFARLKLSDSLVMNDFDVVEACHGLEGLQVMIDEKPDIIICDLLMPVMDGFDFLKQLKEKGNKTPVLILTSDIQEKTKTKAMDLGAIGLIHKPPKYPEVTEMINNVLKVNR